MDFAERWTLNHNTHHESTSTQAAYGLKVVPRRALHCVCFWSTFPWKASASLILLSLILSLKTGLSQMVITEAKCVHRKRKTENMGKTIWMTIKSKSDGQFLARRTPDFPPDFLGQNEAVLWGGAGGSVPYLTLWGFSCLPFLVTLKQILAQQLPFLLRLAARFGAEASSSPEEPFLMACYKGLLHCR